MIQQASAPPGEPRGKLLDQRREILRLKHLSYRPKKPTSAGSNASSCSRGGCYWQDTGRCICQTRVPVRTQAQEHPGRGSMFPRLEAVARSVVRRPLSSYRVRTPHTQLVHTPKDKRVRRKRCQEGRSWLLNAVRPHGASRAGRLMLAGGSRGYSDSPVWANQNCRAACRLRTQSETGRGRVTQARHGR
jgi:hypothetical protein